MTIYHLSMILLIGLLAGMVSGTLGVGGGIIIVPALVFVLGFSQHQAQGTSLVMMLPPVVILAAINYYKSGYVDLKVAGVLMIAFVLGAYLGSKIAISLPAVTLKRVFGVLMLVAAFKMIFGK